MHCTCKTLLGSAFTGSVLRPSGFPPSFLLPAFTATATASFSTSTAASGPFKDGNKNRGVSPLRRTGLTQRQRKALPSLPRPVLDKSKHSTPITSENHGLWGFFPENRSTMMTPEELNSHGRAWAIQELRIKSWDDLHRLWWVCLKERNRVQSGEMERRRVQPEMYGNYESTERVEKIETTMKRIKFVLTERYYAWENARVKAMEDPSYNLYADPEKGEQIYTPPENSLFTEEVAKPSTNEMEESSKPAAAPPS